MMVSFQLRTPDLAAAARYIAEHHPAIKAQLRRAQIVTALLAAVAFFGFVWFVTRGHLRWKDMLFVLGTAVAGYLFARYFLKRNYIQRVVALASDKNPNFQRAMQYTIEAEGLASVSDLGAGTIHWSAIERMDEDTAYIYLTLPLLHDTHVCALP